jgi:hypothetical protein
MRHYGLFTGNSQTFLKILEMSLFIENLAKTGEFDSFCQSGTIKYTLKFTLWTRVNDHFPHSRIL